MPAPDSQSWSLPWSLPLIQAAEAIQAGGVGAYPTEALYGLGCDPLDQRAVQQLLAIKQRPVEKGLILLGADLDQLLPFIELSDTQHQQLRQHWPLATTYVVPASPLTPPWVRGRHSTVAVRVTRHPLAATLARLAGTALVSTSANLSGQPSLRSAVQVHRYLGPLLDFVLQGECNLASRPSTIIDLQSGATLR